MIAPEIKDFEVYKASGKKLVYLMVTLWDEGDTKTNGEILAEYEIEIYDAYANYKIIKKRLKRILHVQPSVQRKQVKYLPIFLLEIKLSITKLK